MKYIKRDVNGIQIDNILVDTSLIKYINNLCIKSHSTIDGRINASKKILLKNSKVPFIINDNILVFPTKSLRDYETILINFFSVMSFKKVQKNKTEIIFNDLTKITIDISLNVLKNQMDLCHNLMHQTSKIESVYK